MRFIVTVFASLLATAAFAQQASPIVIIGGDEPQKPRSQIENERLINQFPAWAVTRAGAATGGYDQDVPTTPQNPPSPNAPTLVQGQNAPVPLSPTPPASPINKLWPADTVPIFVRSCVGYQPKLIIPCKCVIGKLMVEMPHDEFLALSAKGTIEQDGRLQTIRTQCAVPPPAP